MIQKNRMVQRLTIMLLDVVIVGVSVCLACLLRFDFDISAIFSNGVSGWLGFVLVQAAITLVIFSFGRMYSFVWRTVGIHDVCHMVGVVLLNYIIAIIIGFIWKPGIPRSVWFMTLIAQLVLFIGMRCTPRIAADIGNYLSRADRQNAERILLIGGGTAGRMLVQESLSGSRSTGKICCIIDDSEAKRGKYIEGVRIIGGRDQIEEAVKHYRITQIILAIPSAPMEEQKKILELCSATGCHVRIVPGLSQLLNGEAKMGDVRDVQIEDLLGRDPVELNTERLNSFIGNKTVMVTGGGGSIGSELCRQIAKYRPKQLIIVDIYENNAYDIQQELRRTYGVMLDLKVEIASVRDKERTEQIFATYRPDLVFHAAAHKHVPLMENNPMEAIKNNVIGTFNMATLALQNNVGKFVMISTDKAVNPTNVMGASKRCCEMIVQFMSQQEDTKTEFVTTRFGNVLGSNGSVIPLFKRQIEQGKPVTVTHPDIIRYFMTIPEAVSLVLEAASFAKGGQIFVLDMGRPVKIVTLAENLIRMYGKVPYKDVPIKFTGLRPGEKIKEELLMNEEGLEKTSNKLIFVGRQIEIGPSFINQLWDLRNAANGNKDDVAIAALHKIVPTFTTPEAFNKKAGIVS